MNQTCENKKKQFQDRFWPILPKLAPPPSPPHPPKKEFLPLLDVRHCHKQSTYSTSKKIIIQTQANGKKLHFGPDLGPLVPNSGCQIFFMEVVV